MSEKKLYSKDLQDIYYGNLFTWFCGQLTHFNYYIDCRLNFDILGDHTHTVFIKKYTGSGQFYIDNFVLEYISVEDLVKRIDYYNHIL